ncbi:single-stranded DNA-binding protein [Maricaulis sp.]|uniref:single-stranded DNA-binding protein n=1 Tax=Maricaulis sp. TaxID=1486257 RepID=UPI0026206ED4|nr:single-stranded DNA-binding protein [Maricaulis sp.]MDF1769865.1 single-stranded DNA-binding protein [Maricaulis sp.]
MMNRATIIGRLGKDPEIRHTQGGNPVASLSVATDEKWRDKNTGEKHEKTEWHRVVIFAETACKYVENYAQKGSLVLVEGQIQTRKWTDQSGADRYTTEIVVRPFGSQVKILEGFRKAGDDQGTGPASEPQRNDFRNSDLDDEIPF